MAETPELIPHTSERREIQTRAHCHSVAATILVLRGTVGGAELARLAGALDHAVRARPRVVTVDLAELTHWSLVAQAIVLSASRTLARYGGELILAHPTTRLRLQSAQLGVFSRVRTIDTGGERRDAATVSEVGLVTVERRRALLISRRNDPILRLPGGRLNGGDNVRRALAVYIAAQLGINCHEEALLPTTIVSAAASGEPAASASLLSFHAPFSAAILERASTETELVWATYDSSGVFTSTARTALRSLHEDGRID